MPVGQICRCGRIVASRQLHDCEQNRTTAAIDNARRHQKQQDHGRNTYAWRRLRMDALNRDNHACQLRLNGCTGTATTVHIDPRLMGDHTLATLDDCTSACTHCHGVVDGARASRGGRS